MSGEHQTIEKKSLHLVVGKKADFDEIAHECVGMANARGGHIYIGIEDKKDLPPASQKIADSLIETIYKRIPQITHNTIIAPRRVAAANGGEYVDLEVFPSSSIACTSNGRYFLRVSDDNNPLMPDDLSRLMNDKAAFTWETEISQKVPRTRRDEAKTSQFLAMIRASDRDRVSDFVKAKSDEEILEHYLLIKDDFLTNLGVLWIGKREDRVTLSYAPAIQFIKYDEQEIKVNKITWDDHFRNPFELIEAVWNEVPDWQEYFEIPDGMFRQKVPHYPEKVIRELLANAIVHRPYTQRGDIFINLYPDRLEFHNPGLFPLGVTETNILHTSVARNEQLAKVFRALKLMEKEGSGFDMMYDELLSIGKSTPKPSQGNDRVTVLVYRRIIKPEVINFISEADKTFQLTQRERITLGLIAQNESVTAIDLTKALELKNADELKHWIGSLFERGIIKKKGRTRATEYYVDRNLLRTLNFKGKTTLKTITRHRLRELILQDLGTYKTASLSEINERIGNEIHWRRVNRELKTLVDEGKVLSIGENRWRKYSFVE
jgi:ATP-dependent DNA helicase RecG